MSVFIAILYRAADVFYILTLIVAAIIIYGTLSSHGLSHSEPLLIGSVMAGGSAGLGWAVRYIIKGQK